MVSTLLLHLRRTTFSTKARHTLERISISSSTIIRSVRWISSRRQFKQTRPRLTRAVKKCSSLTPSASISHVSLLARCTAPVWDPRWLGSRLSISPVARSCSMSAGVQVLTPSVRLSSFLVFGGIVFDAAPVCEVAAEFIADYGLQTRIRAHAGDLWTDPFPPADVHFYSMIYHDWTPEKCRFLTRKSFESLRPGGHILIHEMLYNDEKTGPFPVAAFSMIMLGWTEGEQYSGREISEMLCAAGFRNIQVKATFGYWGIVTAQKP